MLGAQAVYASEHFFGKKYDNSLFDKVYKSVLSGKDNLTLIGMPACGKTSIGKLLAQNTGKTFVDTDEEIVKKIGMDIPSYFEAYGEKAFREVESQVIMEISAKNNQVIATGGGAVLNQDNARRLKQNGRVYFIDRSLELLCPTSDRPLSSNREAMEKRYNERYHIYCGSCDIRIDGNGSVEGVAKDIYEDYIK